MTYYIYILSNSTGTLYTGVTNDLEQRLHSHREGTGSKFTTRYRIGRLVHFEETPNVAAAIAREKEIKGWRRSKKLALIRANNPSWRDLSEDWYE